MERNVAEIRHLANGYSEISTAVDRTDACARDRRPGRFDGQVRRRRRVVQGLLSERWQAAGPNVVEHDGFRARLVGAELQIRLVPFHGQILGLQRRLVRGGVVLGFVEILPSGSSGGVDRREPPVEQFRPLRDEWFSDLCPLSVCIYHT